jgi:hypothetical protein
LLCLEGEACDFCYNKFASSDALSAEAEDYTTVKAALLERFAPTKDTEAITQDAVEISLVGANVGDFMKRADSPYYEAGFNEEAKFGLPRKAIRWNTMLM